MIFGRESEQLLLDSVLDAAPSQRAAAVALEGPAGIGKTELLSGVCAAAAGRGMLTLRAAGGPLQRDAPFGVARDLFATTLTATSPGELRDVLSGAADGARAALGLETEATGDAFAALNGLYWLTANLADRHPMTIVVDDLQSSDRESLQWLGYLLRRLEDLPIMLAVAARPFEAGDHRELVRAVLDDPGLVNIPLSPLAPRASAAMIRAQLGDSAQEAFCAACHEISAGNPFLLTELLRAARVRGLSPLGANVGALGELGAGQLAGSVQARLRDLGPPSALVAQALAVLGSGARLDQLSKLSGLQLGVASEAVDRLRAVELCRSEGPLEFVHPLIRAAVREGLAPGRLAASHKEAARLLVAEQAPAAEVTPHLLAAPPSGDAWVAAQLRRGARAALAGGAPQSAAAQLRRALAEPPPESECAATALELGLALLHVDPPAARERIAAVHAMIPAHPERAEVAILLADALSFSDRGDEAVRILQRTSAELDGADPVLTMRVQSKLGTYCSFAIRGPRLSEWRAALPDTTTHLRGVNASERSLLRTCAWAKMLAGEPAAEVLATCDRTMGAEISFVDDPGLPSAALLAGTLVACDDFARAGELFLRCAREFEQLGRLTLAPFAYAGVAHVRARQGRLLDSEADARTGWELADQAGRGTLGWWQAGANLLATLCAQGAVDAAADLIDTHWSGRLLPAGALYPSPRVVRGEVRAAQGRHQEAVDDLLGAGAIMEEREHTNPAWSNWQTSAIPSLIALHRAGEARALALRAVDRARRFGAAGGLGRALRFAALTISDEDESVALLRESVAVLEPSPCRLELTETLVELGTRLRRANRRAASRPVLARGLELASACSAAGLAARATDELAAGGAAHIRPRHSAVGTLTASELRVARLAHGGQTNRQIAQHLYVTTKTVEKHLGRVYAKLGIENRARLRRYGDALADPGGSESAAAGAGSVKE